MWSTHRYIVWQFVGNLLLWFLCRKWIFSHQLSSSIILTWSGRQTRSVVCWHLKYFNGQVKCQGVLWYVPLIKAHANRTPTRRLRCLSSFSDLSRGIASNQQPLLTLSIGMSPYYTHILLSGIMEVSIMPLSSVTDSYTGENGTQMGSTMHKCSLEFSSQH